MHRRNLAFIVTFVAAAASLLTTFPDRGPLGTTASGASPPAPWGRFQGRVRAHWPRPDDSDFDPAWPEWQMILDEDFVYFDPRNIQWLAAKGDRLDGASIPRALWGWLVGTPFTGKFRDPSVVHDSYCYRKAKALPGGERSFDDIHRMFYEAMRCAGVGEFEAQTKYFAVRKFGPPSDRGIWERIFGSPKEPTRKPADRGPAAELLSRANHLMSDGQLAAFFAGVQEVSISPLENEPKSFVYQAPPSAQMIATAELARPGEMIELTSAREGLASAKREIASTRQEKSSVREGLGSVKREIASAKEEKASVTKGKEMAAAKESKSSPISNPEPAVPVKPESLVVDPKFFTFTEPAQKEALDAVIYIARHIGKLSLDDLNRLAKEGVPELPRR